MTQLNLSLNLEDIHVLDLIDIVMMSKRLLVQRAEVEEFHTFQMREEKHEKVHHIANLFAFLMK